MGKQKGVESYLATIADYQATFNTDTGRRVLRHLMKVHGIMQTSFVEKDAHATCFNEGARNVVLQILLKMKMSLKDLEEELTTDQGDEYYE